MGEIIGIVLSWMILILGLSYLLQPGNWIQLIQEMTEKPHRAYPFVFFVLIFGLTVVATHNVWEGGWPVVITIFGWLMAIKGAIFLCMPGSATFYRNWSETTFRSMLRIAGAVYVVLGAILVYKLMLIR